MLKSCETLITKINEWQQAILELEKLSDGFLNSSDEKIKEKINNHKREIEKCNQEYLNLAYPELPNGENLFWPEKEMIEEIKERTGIKLDNDVEVKNNHLVTFDLSGID